MKKKNCIPSNNFNKTEVMVWIKVDKVYQKEIFSIRRDTYKC